MLLSRLDLSRKHSGFWFPCTPAHSAKYFKELHTLTISQATKASLHTEDILLNSPNGGADTFVGQIKAFEAASLLAVFPVFCQKWFDQQCCCRLSTARPLKWRSDSFTLLGDFETSLATDMWKAGDPGLTRRRTACVLKGSPHEQERRGSGVSLDHPWSPPHLLTPWRLGA